MCTWTECLRYKANMLLCESVPQVLWLWWVICHAAAVILSVYDRCQIKFILSLKASSQLLNRPLLSAAPRYSEVWAAVFFLITVTHQKNWKRVGFFLFFWFSFIIWSVDWQQAALCFSHRHCPFVSQPYLLKIMPAWRKCALNFKEKRLRPWCFHWPPYWGYSIQRSVKLHDCVMSCEWKKSTLNVVGKKLWNKILNYHFLIRHLKN